MSPANLETPAHGALSTPTDQAIQPYNFLRPPRISKERRIALESIFSRFALSFQAQLSSRLRNPTDVLVSSVRQESFEEFLSALDNPCAAFEVDLGTAVGGQAIFALTPRLAFRILDRLFGGLGDANAIPNRPLTVLEQTVVRGVAERALQLLAEAWDEYLKFAPRIVGFESSPEVLRIANREDNMLAVHFEVRTGADASDLALFATPLIALEGFLQEKSRPVVAAVRQDRAERSAQQLLVQAQLKRAKVPICVRFPLFALSGRDIAGLEVGHVIHTAQPVDTPVEVRVHGRCRFLGRMGKSSGFLGVSISRALQPGEDVSPRLPKGRVIR